MLRTLRSDTKINILNPNLDAKMFMKGVQTYLESIISVPFVPNKRMLWLALRTLKGLKKVCCGHYGLNNHFLK